MLVVSLMFAFNAYISSFVVGLLTWNLKRRARKEVPSRNDNKSTRKSPTATMTTKSGAAGNLTRTDTTMSGAVPSAMHDDSGGKSGSGTGPSLVNWMKHALKSGEGRKKHETGGDEESNGLEKAG